MILSSNKIVHCTQIGCIQSLLLYIGLGDCQQPLTLTSNGYHGSYDYAEVNLSPDLSGSARIG